MANQHCKQNITNNQQSISISNKWTALFLFSKGGDLST